MIVKSVLRERPVAGARLSLAMEIPGATAVLGIKFSLLTRGQDKTAGGMTPAGEYHADNLPGISGHPVRYLATPCIFKTDLRDLSQISIFRGSARNSTK